MLKKFRRTAFIPIIKIGDPGPTESKYSGSFYLPSGHKHPVCTRCAKPLQPFLQLNLKELPAFPEGWLPEPDYSIHRLRGFLQVFFCTNNKCYSTDGGSPFAPSTLVQVAYVGKQSSPEGSPFSDFEFPPKGITGWTKCEHDVPAWNELEKQGVEVTDEILSEIASDHQATDKLLGWPTWVQNVNYPFCPLCGRRMVFLFQISSDGPLGFGFADGGIGQVCVCPEHPVSAFVWACN